jgi:hypothetical protein
VGVVDHAHNLRVLGREPVRELGRGIGAAVVHSDDLVALRHRGQRLQGLRDQRREVALLVVGREEIGERRDGVASCGHWTISQSGL